MRTFIRHLVAIVVLPLTVTVLIPAWIGQRAGVHFVVGANALEISTQLAGVAAAALGFLLFVASLRLFATEGQGTLAPWDPPRNLVVDGLYRYVRHPMISGVLFMLFGEPLVLLSWPHTRWAFLFLCMNLVYIPLLEEPMLEARFGDSYREYRRHVWMFVPRLRPWTPGRPVD